MTDAEKQAFVDKANAQLAADQRHWWTRWWMVQGRDLVVLGASAFSIGWIVATLLITGWAK